MLPPSKSFLLPSPSPLGGCDLPRYPLTLAHKISARLDTSSHPWRLPDKAALWGSSHHRLHL